MVSRYLASVIDRQPCVSQARFPDHFRTNKHPCRFTPVVTWPPSSSPVWAAVNSPDGSDIHTWVGSQYFSELELQVWGFSSSRSAAQFSAAKVVAGGSTEPIRLEQRAAVPAQRMRTFMIRTPAHDCGAVWPCDVQFTVSDSLKQVSVTVRYFKYALPSLRAMFPSQASDQGGAMLTMSFREASGPRTRDSAGIRNTLISAATRRTPVQVFFLCGPEMKNSSSPSVSIRATAERDEYAIQAEVPKSPCGVGDSVVRILIGGQELVLSSGTVSFKYIGAVIKSVAPGAAMLNPGSGGATAALSVENIDAELSNLTVTIGGAPCIVLTSRYQPGTPNRADVQIRLPELSLSLVGRQELKLMANRYDLNATFEYLRPPDPVIDSVSFSVDGARQRWVKTSKLSRVSMRLLYVAPRFGYNVASVQVIFNGQTYTSSNVVQVGDNLDVQVWIAASSLASSAATMIVQLYNDRNVMLASINSLEDSAVASLEVRDVSEPMLVISAPTEAPETGNTFLLLGMCVSTFYVHAYVHTCTHAQVHSVILFMHANNICRNLVLLGYVQEIKLGLDLLVCNCMEPSFCSHFGTHTRKHTVLHTCSYTLQA